MQSPNSSGPFGGGGYPQQNQMPSTGYGQMGSGGPNPGPQGYGQQLGQQFDQMDLGRAPEEEEPMYKGSMVSAGDDPGQRMSGGPGGMGGMGGMGAPPK